MTRVLPDPSEAEAGRPAAAAFLECPRCPDADSLRFDAAEVRCVRCGAAYPVRDGVYVMYSAEGGAADDVAAWKEEERVHHDDVAGRYEESLAPKGEHVAYIEGSRAFRRLTAFLLEARGTVLDYGCGPGADAADFLDRGLTVVATDISEAMLRTTLRKASRTRHPELLTCVLADGERLPFRRDAFGFVSARGVLHHLPRVDAAIAEIGRVLSPGGKARIQEPSARPSPWRGRLQRAARWLPPPPQASPPPSETPPPEDVGTERERPLSGAETLGLCRSAGLDAEIFYWTDHYETLRSLPRGVAWALSDLLAGLDTLGGSGDLFCLLATKRGPRSR